MRILRIICALLVLGIAPVVVSAFAQNGSGGRVALIVSNTNYPDNDAPLTTPLEDARVLGRELERRGYAVTVAEDLTKRGMREAVERFLERLQPGYTAVFHFGGYGIQANRQNYLIPVDAQIWTEPDVVRDGVSLEFILGEIGRRGVRASYAILDAAHRNPFERRFRSYSTGLIPIAAPPPNASVIFSTAGGAVLRQTGGSRSVFGTELVKQVLAADGMSPQVLERTRAGVAELTRNEQVPWVSLAATPSAPAPQPQAPSPSPQVLLPPTPAPPAPRPQAPAPEPEPPARAEPAPRPAPPPLSPPPAIPAPPAVASAPAVPVPAAPVPDPAADFREAERIGTRQAYEDFLARHRTGPEAERARAALARLNEPVTPRKPERVVRPYSREEERLLTELSEKIERNPNDAASIYRRGQLYAIHEDFAKALADFDRVVRVNPRDVEALNNRCWVQAVLDELDKALADCNEALKLRPSFVDALDSRGFVNLKIGLPRLAAADYDAALKMDARHASALYGRGLARLRLGETREGSSDIARAKAINPAVAEDFARFGVQ